MPTLTQSRTAPVTIFTLADAARRYAIESAPVIEHCRRHGIPYATALRPQTALEFAGDLLKSGGTLGRAIEMAECFSKRNDCCGTPRCLEAVRLLQAAREDYTARLGGGHPHFNV